MSIFVQFIDTHMSRSQTDLTSPAVDSMIIEMANLMYGWPGAKKPLIDIQALRIKKGERLFIQGPSGSGKSTLLSLMAGVITPQQGKISVLNQRVDKLRGARRDRFRADHIGFIFQMFNLIPYMTVVENVTLPCLFSDRRRQKVRRNSGGLEDEALRLLEHLDMAEPDLLKRPVTELSVGQQQRVAAARALMGSPEILIADEPTSSLDEAHRQAFIRLLFDECRLNKTTLIFVSHDTSLSMLFDRSVRLGAINTVGRDALNHAEAVS